MLLITLKQKNQNVDSFLLKRITSLIVVNFFKKRSDADLNILLNKNKQLAEFREVIL